MSNQRLQLTWYNKDKALIPTENGKYGYTWVNPEDPRYCETHTLIYDEYIEGNRTPKSDKFEYSERADYIPQKDNLLVLGESGDVLEALTRIPELADKYVGKIKLVYIDPPFNTEKVFDSYEDNLEHSIWLTMMRDRLLHLKKLLSTDGSIWVHLNDAEVHRMRLLLDEVFGIGSFVAEIAWEKTFKPRNDSGGISSRHDIILVYSKGVTQWNRLPRTAAMNAAYTNPDNDPLGDWKSDPVTAPGATSGSNQHPGVYAIQHPVTGELVYPVLGRHWALEQKNILAIMQGWAPYKVIEIDDASHRSKLSGVPVEKLRKGISALMLDVPLEIARKNAMEVYNRGAWPEIYMTGDGSGGFRRKSYLDSKPGKVPEDLWLYTEVGSNDEARNEIKALFPGLSPFSTPKPEKLLERIIHISTNPGDIVLDCFAGSGTTAAVAQKMGRKWITCELIDDTFYSFVKPRLEKVVKNEDFGGITKTEGERIEAEGAELPVDVSPADAASFVSVLNKIIAGDEELKKDVAIKKLKALSKTKLSKDVINWRGGGGFQIAHLSKECFDFDERLNHVMLTENATGINLVKSVAANLGFYLIDPSENSIFDGKKGKSYLKVIEGVTTIEVVDWLSSQIDDSDSLVIATITVMDGVRQYLRKVCKGSKIVTIPDDIFNYNEGDEE